MPKPSGNSIKRERVELEAGTVDAPTGAAELELLTPTGYRVAISTGFNPSTLPHLLDVLAC